MSIVRAAPALTIGEIARRTNKPIHVIEYLLRSRKIRPAAFAGRTRVYDEEALERISSILGEMEERRRLAPLPDELTGASS